MQTDLVHIGWSRPQKAAKRGPRQRPLDPQMLCAITEGWREVELCMKCCAHSLITLAAGRGAGQCPTQPARCCTAPRVATRHTFQVGCLWYDEKHWSTNGKCFVTALLFWHTCKAGHKACMHGASCVCKRQWRGARPRVCGRNPHLVGPGGMLRLSIACCRNERARWAGCTRRRMQRPRSGRGEPPHFLECPSSPHLGG